MTEHRGPLATLARRLSAVALVPALVVGGMVLTAPAAGAVVVPPGLLVEDPPPGLSAPAQPTPDHVTGQALPTVQIDGVVWEQVINGNTVYVGGKFNNARPAGAAAGTNLTERKNLLAYDLATGVLKTDFAPSLNGQVMSLEVSPDGSRLYVGGDFTTANGEPRSRFAVYDTATGALLPFAPEFNTTVNAIEAVGDRVYVGGVFWRIDGLNRDHLASFNAATMTLNSWRPHADDTIYAMAVVPDGSRIIVGGRAQNINFVPAQGPNALSTTDGTLLPWAANQVVHNGNANSSITSIKSQGGYIQVSGYSHGVTRLEGTFSADPNTGQIRWLEDCHGDTYDTFSAHGITYMATHDHYCSTIGGFPQNDSDWSQRLRRVTSMTNRATGTVGVNEYSGYLDYSGLPSPSLYQWTPELPAGTFTGQGQAAWTVEGNDDYVIFGGEFKLANNVAQQGLVRFARKPVAQNLPPRLSAGRFVPTITPLDGTTVRVSWPVNPDSDDLTLTYQVAKNGDLVNYRHTVTDSSPWWSAGTLGFTDTVAAGETVQYRVFVNDPSGNRVAGDTVTWTMPAFTAGSYRDRVKLDGPVSYWPMDEAAGTGVMRDRIGTNDLTLSAGVTQGTSNGAIAGDASATFNGSNTALARTQTMQQAPAEFTVSAWFRTTSTSGGKIVGFGNAFTMGSFRHDRHLYLSNNGTIRFGVRAGGAAVVQSSGSGYNNGAWHQVVGTAGPNGMELYVDGVRVAATPVLAPLTDTRSGYWRIGGDTVSGWTGAPSSAYLNGSIDEVALYDKPLNRNQVRAQWEASGRAVTLPATATDTYASAVLADLPELYYRLDESSGTTANDSSGLAEAGGHSSSPTRVTSPVSGPANRGVTLNGSTGTIASPVSRPASAAWSAELWFTTTTTRGGKLLGMGSARTGNSGQNGRNVWLQNDGRISFGTSADDSTQSIATTTGSYNDGKWHHLVATQGAEGMKLYLDGDVVATHANPTSFPMTGYWRFGGDRGWGSSTSNFVAGSLDEIAVYHRSLTEERVRAHYLAGAVNHRPTAALTATPTDLTVALDGSASTDPDGPIASWQWDLGNGVTRTGATVSYTYPTPGTYTVRLTVTDGSGLKHSVTQPVTVLAPNVLPIAAFTTEIQDIVLTVTSTATDPDGQISSTHWNFGDGATGEGATASHTYAAPGEYTVTQTVTDHRGGVSTTTRPVVARAPNVLPVASFTLAAQRLVLTVDGAGSSDSDGQIIGHAWNFGDGTTAVGATASHTYGAAGTFPVTLTVTDDRGGVHSTTTEVTVSAVNLAPVAAFTATPIDLDVTFDAALSTDTDGSVTGYAWDFGDSSTGTGITATHSYTAAGTFPVTLTVTDNEGATAVTTSSVTVVAPHVAPTASFTSTTDDLSVSVDGSGSVPDTGSTIESYAWDFGDGDIGSGATAVHQYDAAGTYPVTLVVTDQLGVTGTTTADVVVTAPTHVVWAHDTFERSVTNGLGSAETGGAWALSGAASLFAVGGGGAAFTLNRGGAGAAASLGAVSADDSDTVVDLTVDKLGATTYGALTVRQTAAGQYRARILVAAAGTVTLQVTRVLGSAEVVLQSVAVPGATVTAGQPLRLRFSATGSGPTTLTARVWPAAAAEPTDWQVSTSDATPALQGAGSIGIWTYLAGSATNAPVRVLVDNLHSATPGPAPVDDPVAAFTPSVSDLDLAVDGSASTANGGRTIAAHAWDFGDGTGAVGASANHTFAAAGSYVVTLTVTDSEGASGTRSETVTVSAPSGNLVEDTFARTTTGGWGDASIGGAWTLSGAASLFSVADGTGRINLNRAGAGPAAYLMAPAVQNVDATVDLAFDKAATTANGLFGALVVRKTATGDYRAKVIISAAGVVTLNLARVTTGETTLRSVVIPGLTWTAGQTLRIRVEVTGSGTSTLRAKVWPADGVEPDWQNTATDSTPELQAPGGVGLWTYLSAAATNAPVLATFRNLTVAAAV